MTEGILLLFYDRKSLLNYLQNWKREKLAHFWPSYLYIWLINRPIILALKQNITFYQEPDRTSRSMLHVASTNSKQLKTENKNSKDIKGKKNCCSLQLDLNLYSFCPLFIVLMPSCWATLATYKPMVETYIIDFNMENMSKFDVSFLFAVDFHEKLHKPLFDS